MCRLNTSGSNNNTTLRGTHWDLGDLTASHDMAKWADKLSLNEIIGVRLRYTKHQRHRVAHEVIAGLGLTNLKSFQLAGVFVTWLLFH